MLHDNIPLFRVFMSDAAVQNAAATLKSGYIGQGKGEAQFAQELKAYYQSDQLATTNSCTSALHLAYHLLREPDRDLNWPGLEDGDEVLVSPLSCFATYAPILSNRLNIKWVDLVPLSMTMDLNDLRSKITPKTRVICLVHWGGMPHPIEAITRIVDEAESRFGFRPMIIEDCAHSLGATYLNKPLGVGHGTIAAYSLGAIKHLTALNGGFVILPSKRLYDRILKVRWYGLMRDPSGARSMHCEQDIDDPGFKMHMDDVSAAIGSANWSFLPDIVSKHRANATFYRQQLQSLCDVTIPVELLDAKASYWIFTLLVDERDNFQRALESRGIACNQVHLRADNNSCMTKFKTSLPGIDEIESRKICIPAGWWVSEEDRERIVNTIKLGW